MTDTEQQIALCEWMGFKNEPTQMWCFSYGCPSIKSGGYPTRELAIAARDNVLHSFNNVGSVHADYVKSATLPNISSLDVLHEMIARLTEEQCYEFEKHLERTEIGFLWKFNAKQGREALLRTLSLWRE